MLRDDLIQRGMLMFGSALHKLAELGYNIEDVMNSVEDTMVLTMCIGLSSVDDIVSYITKIYTELTDRTYSMQVSKLAGQFYFKMYWSEKASLDDLKRYANMGVFENNFNSIVTSNYDDIWKDMKEQNSALSDNVDTLEELLKAEEDENYVEELVV